MEPIHKSNSSRLKLKCQTSTAKSPVEIFRSRELTDKNPISTHIASDKSPKVVKKKKVKLKKFEIKKRNRQIRKRFANGERAILLVREFGISESRVYEICKGVKRKVKSKKTN